MDENQIIEICSNYIKEITEDAKTSGKLCDADYLLFREAVRSDFTKKQ